MDIIKESLSIYDFQELFPNAESCLKYLFDKKWKHGYLCRKCGHKKHSPGRKNFNLRCTSCGYDESPTAHTLFHKVKFSLEKAFLIIYLMATLKNGMSSLQMQTTVGIQQKTCWKFKLKVMHAMRSSKRYKMCGEVELLIFDMGINHVAKEGEMVKKKKQTVMARESDGGRQAWMYGQYIENLSGRELKKIFSDHLDKKAHITTNGCQGYLRLKNDYKKMETLPPAKLKNLKQPFGKRNFNPNKGLMTFTYRRSMGVFYQIRGTYGHAEYLQTYLDEYFFRRNRSDMSSGKIFELLLNRVIDHPKMSHYEHVTYMDKAPFATLNPKKSPPT